MGTIVNYVRRQTLIINKRNVRFLFAFHLSGIVLQNLVHDCQNLFAQGTRNSFLQSEI